MKTRTWPYGTTRTAKVIEAGTQVNPVEDSENEGHVLMNGAQDDTAKVGDTGKLIFTKGGPTGGFWKFTKDA
jgi:hypothetical protein